MSWTSKQRLSLAGAAGIQAVLFWIFFHQSLHLPAAPKEGIATRIFFLHLPERVHASSSTRHSSLPVLPRAELPSEALQSIPDYSSPSFPDEDWLRATDYLPAALLTEKPLVVMDIDPELSRRFAFIPSQTLELTLLINEYGDVDNVLFADSPAIVSNEYLSVVLLNELKQRFLDARFLPGRLHGQAVRSALNIRVLLGP